LSWQKVSKWIGFFCPCSSVIASALFNLIWWT